MAVGAGSLPTRWEADESDEALRLAVSQMEQTPLRVKLSKTGLRPSEPLRCSPRRHSRTPSPPTHRFSTQAELSPSGPPTPRVCMGAASAAVERSTKDRRLPPSPPGLEGPPGLVPISAPAPEPWQRRGVGTQLCVGAYSAGVAAVAAVAVPLPGATFAGLWVPPPAAAAAEEDELGGAVCLSVGSAGHPYGCAEACRYVKRKGGCREAESCVSCHLCFWRRPAGDVAGAWPGAEGAAAEAPAPQAAAEEVPPSIGTKGHPRCCGAPCRYMRRKGGCRDGTACASCHACVWQRLERNATGPSEASENVDEGQAAWGAPEAEAPMAAAEPLSAFGADASATLRELIAELLGRQLEGGALKIQGAAVPGPLRVA